MVCEQAVNQSPPPKLLRRAKRSREFDLSSLWPAWNNEIQFVSNLWTPWLFRDLTGRQVNSINVQGWAIICLTQLEKWPSDRAWQVVTVWRGLNGHTTQREFAVGSGFVQSFSPFGIILPMCFFLLREETQGDNSWRQREVKTFKCLSVIRLHNQWEVQPLQVI